MMRCLESPSSDGRATPMTECRAISSDGTPIGYLRLGEGPGLILVQGAMGSARNYRQLAQALARDFTVLLPDRRGRGMSPRPYDPQHRIDRDVEDVEAVRAASRGRFVFGLSSGAMIALRAAERLAGVEKAVVYEPPFYPGDIDRSAIARFYAQIERGDLASALVTAGRIAGLAPPLLRFLPNGLARRLTGLVLRRDGLRPRDGYLDMSELLLAMRYDFGVVADMQGAMARRPDLRKPLLVLSGTRSPAYLQTAAAELAACLPIGQHIVLRGLDHSGPWDTDKGGQPNRVSDVVVPFLLSP